MSHTPDLAAVCELLVGCFNDGEILRFFATLPECSNIQDEIPGAIGKAAVAHRAVEHLKNRNESDWIINLGKGLLKARPGKRKSIERVLGVTLPSPSVEPTSATGAEVFYPLPGLRMMYHGVVANDARNRAKQEALDSVGTHEEVILLAHSGVAYLSFTGCHYVFVERLLRERRGLFTALILNPFGTGATELYLNKVRRMGKRANSGSAEDIASQIEVDSAKLFATISAAKTLRRDYPPSTLVEQIRSDGLANRADREVLRGDNPQGLTTQDPSEPTRSPEGEPRTKTSAGDTSRQARVGEANREEDALERHSGMVGFEFRLCRFEPSFTALWTPRSAFFEPYHRSLKSVHNESLSTFELEFDSKAPFGRILHSPGSAEETHLRAFAKSSVTYEKWQKTKDKQHQHALANLSLMRECEELDDREEEILQHVLRKFLDLR